jgi:hypothetical protein
VSDYIPKNDPGDALKNALDDIRDAAETLREVGEGREDRVVLYLSAQLLTYRQQALEAHDKIMHAMPTP